MGVPVGVEVVAKDQWTVDRCDGQQIINDLWPMLDPISLLEANTGEKIMSASLVICLADSRSSTSPFAQCRRLGDGGMQVERWCLVLTSTRPQSSNSGSLFDTISMRSVTDGSGCTEDDNLFVIVVVVVCSLV